MLSYSFNSLIVFSEVVRAGSFSKAADLLGMTQPGVSNHLAQLEAQIGCRLMNRDQGNLCLTKEGKVIFKYAEKIEILAKELDDSIGLLKKDRDPLLKIGTTPVYSRVMMPFMLGSFQKANPNIRIKLDTGSSGDMASSVLAMENDVVVAGDQKVSKKVQTFPLLKEDLVLITCNNHPLSGRKSVSLKEIEGYPLVIREKGSSTRKIVLAALESMRVKPSQLIYMRSTEFIKQWVSQGKGVSILIRRAVLENERKYLKVIPLEENLSLDVSVFFLKSKKSDASIQKLLRHIEELKEKSVLQ
ncbi:MAG: HTH-type transcriptional regulator CysL [Syntrophorhabdus sp. PtaU1.Bin153]|nr:MAG: HTH-type transcriptional regulator CysL [Syntrophorhabdus sp. PtaU1.Bin153]